jgi:ABC-type multidrug transport system ATPase subunit
MQVAVALGADVLVVLLLLLLLLLLSGAGKSTLMDILAGRKSVGELRGTVLVNKQRQRKEHFRKRTAYVPQVCRRCC